LHAQVRALYEGVLRRKGRLVTTNLVLIELVPLLASRTRISRKEIFAYIDSLRAAPFLTMVRIDEQTENAAWDMLKQYGDKEWSVVDACSFLVMRQLGIAEALTTDQHFTQFGFTRLPQP
jgi:uncharacterized protein